MIPFGEWLPDQSDLGSVGTTVAKNVIPAARGYRPFLGLAELSAATDAHLRGFFGSIDSDSESEVPLRDGLLALEVAEEIMRQI